MRIYLLFFGIVLLSSIAIAQQDPIFFADFENCDGSSGVCANFSPQFGSWEIQGGEYKGGGYAISTVNNLSCLSNCDFEAIITKLYGGYGGLTFRYADAGNSYVFYVQQTGEVIVTKFVNGQSIEINTSTFVYNASESISLRIVVNGNNFLGYVNGAPLISVVDYNLNSGSVGLYTYAGESYFDNFTVHNAFVITNEVCDDNIDNDLDSLVDCTDLYDCYGYCIENMQQNITTLQSKVSILEAQNQQLQQQVNQNKGFINNLIKKVNGIMCYLKLGPCIASNTIEEKTT